MSSTAGLRLGVVVPEGELAWWRRELLQSLMAARPESLVVLARAGQGPDLPLAWRLLLGAQGLLWKANPDVLALKPESRQASWPVLPFNQADAADLDLVVNTCPAPVPDSLRQGTSLGVWDLEPVPARGFGPGFLESRLVWRPGQGQARLIMNAYTCAPGPGPWYWARVGLAKAAHLPARALARLRSQGWAYLEGCPLAVEGGSWGPGPGTGPALFGRVLAWGLGKAWRDLFYRRQWFLAWRQKPGDIGQPGYQSRAFRPLYPPKGTGWADPFLIRRGQGTYCFIEEITASGKGVISVLEARGQGEWTGPRRVLEEPFHLSYPYVFSHEGRMYLMPESGQAGRVALYRAEDFPGGWVLDRELLSGVTAVDATLLEHGGKWWMFVNQKVPGGSSWDELHLYHAPCLLGPFSPHPANPVVSDVRRARPAGRVFAHEGRLFRPGQDCSGWYGRALAIMEIVRLDETGYEERPVARLEPELIPDSFCLHTLAVLDDLEVVDGQRWLPFIGRP